MASSDERFTAEQWAQIRQSYRDQPQEAVRSMFPQPESVRGPGPFVPERPHEPMFRLHSHLEEFLQSLSAADVRKLQSVIDLRPETVAWLGGKSDREIKSLDGAVEFISSSRTAAKVLMWVMGTAVAFIGGVVALAKNGYDMFSMLRGLGK